MLGVVTHCTPQLVPSSIAPQWRRIDKRRERKSEWRCGRARKREQKRRGGRGGGGFVLDAMRSKFDGGLRVRGDHPTSSGIARRRSPTDRRASKGNRADYDETTVGEGHIAVVVDADSGGGEESSSVRHRPSDGGYTTATVLSPPAANRSGRVTIPSFLKTREESTSASVVVVPSVDECATTKKTAATTDEIASPVPAAATAAVPVVAIGGGGSTSASSPGGGRRRLLQPQAVGRG